MHLLRLMIRLMSQQPSLRQVSTVSVSLKRPMVTIYVNNRINSYALPKELSEDRTAFLAMYPQLLEEMLSIGRQSPMPPSVTLQHFRKFMEYTVLPNSHLYRGLAIATSYRELHKTPKEVTTEQIFLCSVLGWCIELLHVQFLVVDDIVDKSPLRNGKPTWFQLNDVGLHAVPDTYMLYYMVTRLITKHFSKQPYYTQLLETTNESMLRCFTGVSTDLLLRSKQKKITPGKTFTMKDYMTSVEYKSSFSYIYAIKLALLVNGITDPIIYEQTRDLLSLVGQLHQIKNDTADVYEDSTLLKKEGSDIQNGVCSWLIASAMQLGNARQIEILQENYGKDDLECIQRVKDVYSELNLLEHYEEHARNLYSKIETRLEDPAFKLPTRMFYNMINAFYRNKSVP